MAAHTARRVIRFLSVSVLVAAVLLMPGPAQAAGTWHTALAVPGLATLSAGNVTNFASVSCASVGNCSAGGYYIDSSGNGQAYVVDEVSSVWKAATEVPGTAALNSSFAETVSISCFSAGNCSAGGLYGNGPNQFPFVADRVSGTWHTAKQVPGTAALNTGLNGFLQSVSCRTGGNCSAVGVYQDSQSHRQAFVVNRVSGSWGQAKEILGTGTLNAGGSAFAESVSCGSAGNCSTGGEYADSSGNTQVYVANRVNGTWHAAVELPGTAALNAGGNASLSGVSCGAALNCSAVGFYTDTSFVRHAFVANRVNGTWHNAFQAPGVATLSAGHNATLTSVSCPTAGNCSAGGFYLDSSGSQQAFVLSEVNGHWNNALPVPGLAALNTNGLAEVRTVSCASAGNCAAGGDYRDSPDRSQAFVVDEVNGVWGNALEVPGTATLNAGTNARVVSATVVSLSCRSSTGCSAGGFYTDGSSHLQAFVVDKS